MKTLLQTLAGSILICCCLGCQTALKYHLNPEFSEGEIRSKTWDDDHGHRLVLVNWSETHLQRGEDLIIAAYGREGSPSTNAVDFYIVTQVPNRKFALIYHDSSSSSLIASIDFVDSIKETLINIRRHGLPGTVAQVSDKTIPEPWTDYSIAYEADDTIIPGSGVIIGGFWDKEKP